MGELNDDLSSFARAIVQGDTPSQEIDTVYQNYSAATAIEVYRNNYRGNLHDALAGAYPIIEQLVGKDFFRLMTRKFIGLYPSHSGNLYHYGAEMASFAATFSPVQGLPYLSDVAALEWACHAAYFAEDAATLDIGKLSELLPEHYAGLVFLTHPACHVLDSNYPLVEIWDAHQPDKQCDFHIDLDSGASHALVSRVDDVVLVTELSDAEADWLSRIQAGTTLGEATSGTLARYPDFDLQGTLLNMVSKGALTDFKSGAMP